MTTENRYNEWNVYIGFRVIDTVFFNADCDAEYVYDSLVMHDGYPPEIVVQKVK